jgi:hypothetical protein
MNTRKKSGKPFVLFLAVALVTVSIVSAATMYEEREGAYAAPAGIAISTPQELALIGNDAAYPLNEDYYLANDIDFAAGGGVDTNGAAAGNFTPIGDITDPFVGKFDGNGHKISGLNVSTYVPDDTAFAGLFGVIFDADISNLGIVDGSFMAKGDDAFAGSIAGGIVNYESSSITNCYSTSKVTALSVSLTGNSFIESVAGGLVGYVVNSGDSLSLTVTGCYNAGPVTASTEDSPGMSKAYAGGIIGAITCADAESVYITNCYNTGTITAYTGGDAHAGGLIGLATINAGPASLYVTNCYNAGMIIVDSYNATHTTLFANLVGMVNDLPISVLSFTNCYFLEDIFIFEGKKLNNLYPRLAHSTVGIHLLDGFIYIPTIDLYSPRQIQPSGIFTAAEMTPTLADAKSGNSIYYTGETTVNGKTVSGWDFDNVWTIIPGVNNGYPILGVAPAPGAVTGIGIIINLRINETLMLTADVKPSDAIDKGVVWSSSNSAAATVDQDGNVKGIAIGTTVITVKTNDGGYTAYCTVKVIEAAPGTTNPGNTNPGTPNTGSKSPGTTNPGTTDPGKKTYSVMLDQGTGYTIVPIDGPASDIKEGESFFFKLELDNQYGKSLPVVMVNGVQILPDENGIYSIKDISEAKNVTVSGVEKDADEGNSNTVLIVAGAVTALAIVGAAGYFLIFRPRVG